MLLCKHIFVNRLSDGGLLALFDWAEHFDYPKEVCDIPHMGGISKSWWMQFAADLVDAVEQPSRVKRQWAYAQELPPGNRPKFAASPLFRVKACVAIYSCILLFFSLVCCCHAEGNEFTVCTTFCMTFQNGDLALCAVVGECWNFPGPPCERASSSEW